MSEATSVQQEVERVDSKEETRSQLDRHLEQQPASIQTAQKLMLALEAVILVLYIGLLIVAVYVSVTWKTHGELAVPRWWMASQVGAGLGMVILGLHSLMVRAYLPLPSSSGKDSIVTGRKAVSQAWKLMGLGLLWAVAWAGMYLGIVLSGAEPLQVFIPFVVAISIGVGILSIGRAIF
jgi:hypothetical protein